MAYYRAETYTGIRPGNEWEDTYMSPAILLNPWMKLLDPQRRAAVENAKRPGQIEMLKKKEDLNVP